MRLLEKLKVIAHNLLGYGFPTARRGGDSFQPTFGCRYCPGELAQDSQGNWFHLTGSSL